MGGELSPIWCTDAEHTGRRNLQKAGVHQTFTLILKQNNTIESADRLKETEGEKEEVERQSERLLTVGMKVRNCCCPCVGASGNTSDLFGTFLLLSS